ncbi:NUDIX hydrolase [Salaquimonas pukyongi]|uniref:NUDIX hydrolase n=1 Tax=Salaquimonas pukyongi TaxID=2712698 RepID=UPI00096BC071|nr:NUDIX hydrolase [Salaquimonas pukyongi]
MTTTAISFSPLRHLANSLALLLQRPPRRQVAALCYRRRKGKTEVLLVTTRNTKRWILPKGWPGARRSAAKTATIEAYEEAGIIGEVANRPLGEYRSQKGLGNGFTVRTAVTVFPLKVSKQVSDFPESGERKQRWLTPEQAAELCGDEGLRDILLSPKAKSLLMAA